MPKSCQHPGLKAILNGLNNHIFMHKSATAYCAKMDWIDWIVESAE